jgi:sugar transferase (PEP-CTERM system associated)
MPIRVFRHYIHVHIAMLAAIEGLVFFLAFCVPGYLRVGLGLTDVQPDIASVAPRALLFAVVMLVCMLATGLYSSRQRARAAGIVVRVATSIFAAAAIIAVLAYSIPQLHIGRGILGLGVLLAFVSAVLVRIVFDRIADENIFKRRVLVYGSGRQALSISNLRRRSDQRGFIVVGYVRGDGDRDSVPSDRVIDMPASMLEFANNNSVDEIVVAMDDRRRAFPLRDLLECRLQGIEVVDLVSFLERETGRVRLDVLNPSWMIFAEGFRRDPVRLFSERAFDLIASLLLLLLAWPIMLLTAILIKIEDGPRAPVFYRQTRVGLGGRNFDALKFRSMRPDAEKDGRPQWARPGDSRVTRVGAFIRKVRIDELPQILNVLKSDMSFVGPRPERPEFVAVLNDKIPYYSERHCVKPGITGWAQLCHPYGSSEQDAAEKLQYDLYYIKNHSLLFDILILLQTAEVILWRKGAR